MALSKELERNCKSIADIFGNSSDFYTKHLVIGGVRCCIVLLTGISSPEKLCIMALQAMQQMKGQHRGMDGCQLAMYLMRHSCLPTESDAVQSVTQAVELLSNGMALLLIDGWDKALAFSTQDMPQRTVGKPATEGTLRGSQEAFTELLRNNIAMLRHQFRNGSLVAEIATADTRAKTEYSLCYDKALVPPETLQQLRQRLSEIKIPVLLDTSYFASFLKTDKFNLFQASAYTERPATAAARISEGKIVVLVAGSPNAMIIPAFFSESFESLDDYSSGAVFSGLIRILKYCAFVLSVFGPGLYVVAISYAPEIIPVQLLSTLAAGEAKTPLPPVLEMIMVCLLLEIIREAGLRAPSAISQSVSLVGALIIGDTAVSAGVVSVPVLTMAAAATIATLAVPALYEQSIIFRFFLLVLCGSFGVAGMACGAITILAMACGSEMLGFNYLYPLLPLQRLSFFDGFVRSIWSRLAKGGEKLKNDKTL